MDFEDEVRAMIPVVAWGTRPAGTRMPVLDRTPEQLARVRDESARLWVTLFDIYISTQIGYTTAIGDLHTLTGLDHNYIHSLVAWTMSAEHPDVVDLYTEDQT
jgi:hypothetical protein